MSYKINNNIIITNDKTLAAKQVTYHGTATMVVAVPAGAQGTISGYTSGGADGIGQCNIIDKFPFATDANATDVGDLTVARCFISGQSSTESGYTSGGCAPPGIYSNVIDKFPFATDTNATDVGDLTQGRNRIAGQSSLISGYISGGCASGVPNDAQNTIDKFPFATDTNATDVGDLTLGVRNITGQSSSSSGYTSGGECILYGWLANIDKFPFAVDINATTIGDLTLARSQATGQNSATHGYTSGGAYAPPPITTGRTDTIDKFPFATDANATDVGDLNNTVTIAAGQSSTVSGYMSGGQRPGIPFSVDIYKFPFATDTNATDVGDLTTGRSSLGAGQQV